MFIPTNEINTSSPIPDAGDHVAEITDVVDIGEQNTQYGKRHQVKLVLSLDDGAFTISKRITKTGNMGGNLYAVAASLNALRAGGGIDTDLMKRKRFYIEVSHFPDRQTGQPRAAVRLNTIRLMNGAGAPRQQYAPPQQVNYRQPSPYPQPPINNSQITQSNPITDEDIPF